VFSHLIWKEYSLEFYSLIFGSILVSLLPLFLKIQKNFKTYLFLICSFAMNFWFFYLLKDSFISAQDIDSYMLLPAGFVAAIALVVPGVSGSYILILFELYETLLMGLKNMNMLLIWYFLIGLVLGLVVMVNMMKWVLKQYFNETVATIIGLILGSLYGLWVILETHIVAGDHRWVFYMLVPALSTTLYICARFLIKKLIT